MDSGTLIHGFWIVFISTVAAWAMATITAKRYLKWTKDKQQELASARRALELIEKDAREYQSDLLSDLMLAHVERYKAREIER